jgi:hypothetical protein
MRHPLIMGTWTTCTPGRLRRIASSVSNGRADRAGQTTSRSFSCPAAICVCAKSARRASTPAHFATASRTPASKSTCLDLQPPSPIRSGPMCRSHCFLAKIWMLSRSTTTSRMPSRGSTCHDLQLHHHWCGPVRSEVVIVKCQDLHLPLVSPAHFSMTIFPLSMYMLH